MGYNKYHNKKTEKYNKIWDSEMELDFYENQCLPRLKSGEYISVETQVTFILQKGFKIDGKSIHHQLSPLPSPKVINTDS